MRFFGVAIAVLAAFSSFSAAQAQSIASVGGPRELPPASFTGQQYVDSRGCVFLKAGYGGQTTWVPRVNAERKALCGFPPTFGAVRAQAAAPAPAPAPRVARPAAVAPTPPAIDPATYAPAPYTPPERRTVARRPAAVPPVRTPAPAPYAASAPQVVAAAPAAGPGPGKIGCYTSAPVPEVVQLRNGGLAVVCTRGDGSLSGWRSPIYPAGAGVGAALTDPVLHTPAQRSAAPRPAAPVRIATGATATAPAAARPAARTVPTPPSGYKLAWTDDRLNPNRGQGTAAGQAAQDQIWTRDVPATLVAQAPTKATLLTVSSKTPPAAPATEKAAGPGRLVQVGSFAEPANADAAAARLAALGLPVAKSRSTRSGKTLQTVFAGPFADAATAQAALTAARRSGFADAFLR